MNAIDSTAIGPISASDLVTIAPTESSEVIRIGRDGKLFWRGREVETDDDFRAAMRDLAKNLGGTCR